MGGPGLRGADPARRADKGNPFVNRPGEPGPDIHRTDGRRSLGSPRFDRQSASDARNGLGGWRGRRQQRLIGFGRALGMDPCAPHRESSAFAGGLRCGPSLGFLSVPCNPPDLPSQSDSRFGRLPEGPAPRRARVHGRESVTGAVRPSRRPTTWNALHAGVAQIDVTEIAWIISHLNLSEPVALGDENAEP